MQQTGICTDNQRRKFYQSRGNKQRASSSETKARRPCRFKRGAFGRSTTENDLRSARLKMPCQFQKIFERPVFPRTTCERLDEQRWVISIQFVRNEKPPSLVQHPYRQ